MLGLNWRANPTMYSKYKFKHGQPHIGIGSCIHPAYTSSDPRGESFSLLWQDLLHFRQLEKRKRDAIEEGRKRGIKFCNLIPSLIERKWKSGKQVLWCWFLERERDVIEEGQEAKRWVLQLNSSPRKSHQGCPNGTGEESDSYLLRNGEIQEQVNS